MADAGVIIKADLKEEDLTRKIDKLVQDVDNKFKDMADKVDASIQKVATSLGNFKTIAQTNVREIKDAFQQLGTTFDQFARAMERAATAASGGSGRGGIGSGSSGGGSATAPDTIGALKAEIDAQKKLLDGLQQESTILQQQVDILRQKEASLKRQLTSSEKLRQQDFRKDFGAINSMSTTSFDKANAKLMLLKRLMTELNSKMLASGLGDKFLPQSMWNRLQKAIDTTEQKLERLRKTANMPTTLNMHNVMGMSEKTLNEISAKMQAISQLRAQTPVGSADISRLNAEYARLSKLQTEVLGKNAALVESNNSLGRAFNYIKNRLAFMLTIGAFTNFVRQLYEIRGQYELLERSLGVLLDSFSKGSQIFNELNAMAIKSPFTLIELGTAAKQLSAYNFKATEVVDTTRRLADISAALGVPMERLVYNLGQIRAQTVLTSRDARDFANAGLAIVPELAKYYTELEGKVVSTADVFNRMKKRAVEYNDVMAVLYKITDEGGKFFDFQAKQAGTLKVQLANLNLAWNNMLNDMGKANQGLISMPVKGLREMFLHWQDISKAINIAVGALGAYKLAQFVISKTVGASNRALTASAQAEARANVTRLRRIQLTRQLTTEEEIELAQSRLLLRSKQAMNEADYANMLSKAKLSKVQATQLITFNKTNLALREAIISTGLLTREEATNAAMVGKWSLMWKRALISIKAFLGTLKSIMFTPMTGIMAIAMIAAEIYSTWSSATEAVKEFNKELANSSKESYESLSKFLGQYASQDLTQEDAKKTWQAMREEIIKSSAAGQDFVAELEQINDVNARVKKGFEYVSSIQKVHGALQEIDGDVIKIQQDWSKWWNLGLANDSMMENLDQYIDRLHQIRENLDKALANGTVKEGYDPFAVTSAELEQLQVNLDKTAESMLNLFTSKNFTPREEREAFTKSVDEMVEKYNMSVEQALHFRAQLEQRYKQARWNLFLQENEDQAEELYKYWNHNFGYRQSLEDEFLKWMSRNHHSEVQTMFGNMKAEEIKQINWSEPKWAEWANKNASEFAKQYNLSFDDLRYLVNAANRMSIRIPVFFDFIDNQKSVYDALTDADQAADAAYNKRKRLLERMNQLVAQGKKNTDDYTDAESAAKEALDDYNEALKKGGKSKSAEADANKRAASANKANAAARKAQAKAESELQKALKEEIQIVDKAQKEYKDLTKAGVSRQDALAFSTSGFDKSIEQINKVFKKWGLEAFDLSKYAGVQNPREILNILQAQLDKLLASGKAKPEEVKELEVKIKELQLDAEKYDKSKIINGLNNELGKIKEEYELAVELDANPELGAMFADAFGIDTTNFPKTVQEAVDRMQDAANKAIAENIFGQGIDMDAEDLMHPFNILQDDIEQWAKETGQSMESDLVKKLQDAQKQARDLVTKDAKETIQNWQKLLEKYAEYETKKAEIQRKAEQERETARKHGATQEIMDAIDLKELREIEKLNFDEFQKSATWITATGDLSTLTNKALQMLIDRLWEYKKAAKNLDPKEIIRLNNAMRKLRKEQKKDNPFAAWSIMLDEAKQRMEQYEPDIDELNRKITEMLKKQAEQHGMLSDEDNQTLGEYIKKLKQLKEEQKEVGEITLGDKIAAIQKYSSAVKEIADSVANIADGLGAEDVSQAASALKDALGVIDKAETGYKLGGQWGAVAGAVVGIVEMVVKWADNNEVINDQIKEQERNIKRLENSYKNLQHAMENAYGMAKYEAQQAMIYNKKLQLASLERQLDLEKSRKSKHRDEDAIISLEGQIIDLKNEIHDATTSIVNDLLGISSVSDFADNLVKSMIDAFKQGEDYMKVFEESFEDMVDNMIMKAVVSKLIGDYVQRIFDQINEKKAAGVQDIADRINYWKHVIEGIDETKDLYDSVEAYQAARQQFVDLLERDQKLYQDATTITPEDIASMREEIELGKQGLKEGFDALMEAFGIKFGQGAGEAELSALQQGIQGITEDTASALEAYMNGVSQQVYYQSDILTQIRDILINFGGDVTIATNAQILFELQQSYQVQMSIQSILQGWSNASGLAMRVELVS